MIPSEKAHSGISLRCATKNAVQKGKDEKEKNKMDDGDCTFLCSASFRVQSL